MTGTRAVFLLCASLLIAGCATLRKQPPEIPFGPYSSDQHNDFGVVYESEGDLARAEQQYRLAIGKNADNEVAWTNLGNVLKRQGSLEEAAEAYRTALAIDRGYGPAVNNLAQVYIEQGYAEAAVTFIDAHLEAVEKTFRTALNETREEALTARSLR